MPGDCNCRQQLGDAAMELRKDADRLRRNRRTARNADWALARASAYGAAVGYLNQLEQKMTDTITTVTPEIERDRFGRPMVTPPSGGKKIPYRRCTTFVGVLEDTWNLSRWSQRNVAIGLADRPDLLLGVAAHRDDKDKLNKLCEDAAEAAKAHAAATTGTALHALTEIVDRGLEMPILPESAVADIDAYRAATTSLEMVQVEQFGVLDDLKVGGTWDRLVRHQGRCYIADVKTGNIDWGVAKIAMQLAVYSRCIPYDHIAKVRTPHTEPVDQDRGLIIHLPAGTGTCKLVWVDIAVGWEGVAVATDVWAWRARKNLTTPFTDALDTPVIDLAVLIVDAPTTDALTELWATHQDIWLPEHTELAKTRKTALTASAA